MKTTAVFIGFVLSVFYGVSREAPLDTPADKPVVRTKSGLVGVWQPTAVWSGSARASGYAVAESRVACPGLRIFTERYYSLVQQPGTDPRPRLRVDGANSAEDSGQRGVHLVRTPEHTRLLATQSLRDRSSRRIHRTWVGHLKQSLPTGWSRTRSGSSRMGSNRGSQVT